MSDPLAQLQAALARGSSTALAVEMRDATGAPTNDFAHLASFFFSGSGAQFPRDTLTRYTVKELLGGGSLAGAAAINATPNYYPLDAVYFAYVKRDVGHADYFQECQRLGIKMVQLTQKSDLFEYLDNTQATSKYVDTSALDPNQRSIVAAAAVPFNAEDQQVLKRAATDTADDAEEKRARVATTAIRPLATSLVQEQSAIDRAKEITDAEHVLVDRSTVTSCPLMNKVA